MKASIFDYLPRVGAFCALALFVASPSLAAPINYGDFNDYGNGGVVEYQDVTESSSTDAVPLFGPPEVNVNQLDFDPLAFGSSASNGDLDITDAQLNLMFQSLQGTGLKRLKIDEGGDYSIFGGGASTSVNAGIYADVMVTQITELISGTVINLAPQDQFHVIGSTSAMYTVAGLSSPWSLGLQLEFGPGLTSNGYASDGVTTDYVVSAGEFVLNNTLVADSEQGTLAFIAKKDFKITPEGSLDPDLVVPEPTAAVLAGLALVGLARRR